MSKFLTQSKTFLPMVMQKSTTDAIQVLEKYPSLCTAQHQELPKQELQKQEESKQETHIQEISKIEPLPHKVLKQITPKENLKITLHEITKIPGDAYKIPETLKIPVAAGSPSAAPGAAPSSAPSSPQSLQVSTVDSNNQKSLLRALILDLMQLHRGLLFLMSVGRVWLSQRMLTDRVVPGASGVVRMVQPQLKSKDPEPILPPGLKKAKAKSKGEVKNETPIKLNLGEAIVENLPAWQESISNNLGKLQKTVVEKMSK